MKLLQQLFGVSLPLFGRSKKTKNNADNSNSNDSSATVVISNKPIVDNYPPPCNASSRLLNAGGSTSYIVTPASAVLLTAAAYRNHHAFSAASPHHQTFGGSTAAPPTRSDRNANCWSPTPSIRSGSSGCWTENSSSSGCGEVDAAELDLSSTSTGSSPTSLPRSRSLIRTNPWLQQLPASPIFSPRATRAASPMSVSSGSAASTLASPEDEDEVLSVIAADPTTPPEMEELTTEILATGSDGYSSITTSMSTTISEPEVTTGSSSDADQMMQMSVDSLASMFHQMSPLRSMTSSSGVGDSSNSAIAISVSGFGSTCGSVEDDATSGCNPLDVNRNERQAFDASGENPEIEKNAENETAADTEELPVQLSAKSRSTDVEISPLALTRHLSRVQSVFESHERGEKSPFDDFLSIDSDDFSVTTSTRSPDDDDLEYMGVTGDRTVGDIKSSLAASVERLHRDRHAVDEAFRRARSEERQRARELARIRRRVAEARRDVLLHTLRELSRDLGGQCRRLQAAYDALLAARWPALHGRPVGPTAGPASVDELVRGHVTAV